VRGHICALAAKCPQIFYADSRSHIHLFEGLILKGNEHELSMEQKSDKPLVITQGERGAVIVSEGEQIKIPAFPVEGRVDVCGAGDAFSAAFVGAYSAGATLYEAGWLGSLAASFCVSQIGTTGVITPDMLMARGKRKERLP
jgi:sugar/nucleoside kinase (ribokinase family)